MVTNRNKIGLSTKISKTNNEIKIKLIKNDKST